MGDIFSLETPESVTVGYEVAGVGTRFLAALVDTAIQVAIVVAVFVVMAALGGSISGAGGFVAIAIGILIISIVLLGYYIFFELIWNGQSPGKRTLHLRVIQTNGYPVTPFAILIRNILRLIDWLPSLYAVGVIAMIANRRAQRLGDLAAGTMVVKEGREGRLSSLPDASVQAGTSRLDTPLAPPLGTLSPSAWNGSVTAPGASPAYQPAAAPRYGAAPDTQALVAAGAHLDRLTPEDEVLIRDFLQRRSTLTFERRDELAQRIAAVIYDRIGGTPVLQHGAVLPPEAYLELVLATREAG